MPRRSRTSKKRVRRLMRARGLQAPHRVSHLHGRRAHGGTAATDAPDIMWGTDMTATVATEEGTASVFVGIDRCTAECVASALPGAATAWKPWSP